MSDPNVTTVSPPSGGGLGNPAAAGAVAPAVAPAESAPTFASVLAAAERAAANGQPAVAPVVPEPGLGTLGQPAVTAPVVPTTPAVTIEQLQAQLAAMPKSDELQQLRELAAWGYQEQLRQRMAAQVQQPPQPGPAQQASVQPHPVTGVIPFSDNDRAWLTNGADGQVATHPGAPADVLPRFHAHQRSLVEATRKFMSDPESMLVPMIQKHAAEIARQQAQGLSQEQQTKTAWDSIHAKVSPWLYEGGVPTPDFRGQPSNLTQNGAIYTGVVEKLWNGGKTNLSPDEIDSIAQNVAGMAALRPRLQQLQTPAAPQAPAQPAAPAAPAQPQLSPAQLLAAQQADILARAQAQAAQAPLIPNIQVQPATPGRAPSFLEVFRQASLANGVTPAL